MSLLELLAPRDIIYLILVIALAAYCFYFYARYIHRRRYTRERFAFFALGVYVNTFFFVMTIVLSGHLPFNRVIFSAFGYDLALTAEASALGFSDRALIFLCWCLIVYASLRLYDRWPGAVSQYRAEQPGASSTYMTDLYRILTDPDLRTLALSIRLERQPTRDDLLPPQPSIRWQGPARAAALLMANDPQFKLLPDHDWHPRYNAFLGRYGTDADAFIVFYFATVQDFLASSGPALIDTSFKSHAKYLILEENTCDRELLPACFNDVFTCRELMQIAPDLQVYK